MKSESRTREFLRSTQSTTRNGSRANRSADAGTRIPAITTCCCVRLRSRSASPSAALSCSRNPVSGSQVSCSALGGSHEAQTTGKSSCRCPKPDAIATPGPEPLKRSLKTTRRWMSRRLRRRFSVTCDAVFSQHGRNQKRTLRRMARRCASIGVPRGVGLFGRPCSSLQSGRRK